MIVRYELCACLKKFDSRESARRGGDYFQVGLALTWRRLWEVLYDLKIRERDVGCSGRIPI